MRYRIIAITGLLMRLLRKIIDEELEIMDKYYAQYE